MIVIKIYQVLNQTQVEVRLSSQTGQTVEAATWCGYIDPADAPSGLSEVIFNAFMSIEGYASEISSEVSC